MAGPGLTAWEPAAWEPAALGSGARGFAARGLGGSGSMAGPRLACFAEGLEARAAAHQQAGTKGDKPERAEGHMRLTCAL